MKNLRRVPVYVKADTEDEIILKMLKVNIQKDREHEWSWPKERKDGTWIVWYYKAEHDELSK